MLIMVLFVGCSKGEDGFKQQTIIQTDEAIKAENRNKEEWAKKLGPDLKITRDFIDAVEGEYEGDFFVGEISYNIRLILSATIPAYDIERTRTISELEYEMQNLKLNVHVTQWNSETNLSSVGCVIEGISPDRENGILNLIRESCNNTYQLFLSEDKFEETDARTQSRAIADMLKTGQIQRVDHLKGKLRSSTNAKIYNFNLVRI